MTTGNKLPTLINSVRDDYDFRHPVVTVEAYCKWYCLWVRFKDRVEEAEFPDEGEYKTLGSPYLDHAPNPRHVVRWAKRMGYVIDDLALELIVGRWELEAGRRYDDMLEELV